MDMRRVIRAHNKKYHVGYQKKMSGLKAAVEKWNLVPTPTGKGRKAKMSAADRKTNQKNIGGQPKLNLKQIWQRKYGALRRRDKALLQELLRASLNSKYR